MARATMGLMRIAGEFDILHSHLTMATVAAVVAGAVVDRPVVETRHFLRLAYQDGNSARRVMGRTLRWILHNRVALTLAPSRAVSATANGPCELVPHGITSASDLHRLAPVGNGSFVTVGRLESDRRQDLLLRAFSLGCENLPASASLTVVGDGSQRGRLEALSRQLGISERVRWTGWMADPTPELVKAETYLAPPFSPVPEAFGLAVLEAMLAGLPVIAESEGGVTDLVETGVTGVLVAPLEQAFASAMVAVAGDPESLSRMGQEGRRRAETQFSRDAMIQKTVASYQRVVSARRAERHPLRVRSLVTDMSARLGRRG